MSLGLDIMEAVKRGGMNKWKPLTLDEVNENIKSKKEQAIDFVYSFMGNKRWTINQLGDALADKFATETVREYVNRLHKRGLLKRSKNYPYAYWREV